MQDDNTITEARDAIIAATLPHIAFDGLTARALKDGIEDAGYGEDMYYRCFPDEMRDFVSYWADYGDRRMQAAMAAHEDLAVMGEPERLAAAIRARLEVDAADKHSVRRISSYLALPTNATLAARLTFRTVNAIWYAAGDTSTDFRYYTKRATLIPLYSTTVLYWLNDESEDSAETWAFLDRMLSGADRLGHVTTLFRPPNPFRLISGPLSGLRDRVANRFG